MTDRDRSNKYLRYAVGILSLSVVYLWASPRITEWRSSKRLLYPTFVSDPEAVIIYPLLRGHFMCGDHFRSDGMGLGDVLGTDCVLTGRVAALGRDAPLVLYRNDGKLNEDWIGWHAVLLAPFDAIVESVNHNPIVNAVGKAGSGRASDIVFVRSDSTRVTFGHVDSIFVTPGQTVRAGTPVATVGNNGQSSSPHTHVGAWKGSTPLPIRFDLSVTPR